jgi:hypothetical protein
VSAKRYVANRGNDLTDIVNVGVEKDVYGFAFNIDAILVGWKKDSNGIGYGMRYGHFGKYKTGSKIPLRIRTIDRKIVGYYGDIQLLLGYSGYYHEPIKPKDRRSERKQVRFAILGATGMKSTPRKFYLINEPRESYCYLPIEISLGVSYGIRIGFNPHEFVDLIAGIIGFDPLDDDIDGIPQPTLSKNNWEERLNDLDNKITESHPIVYENIPMVPIEKSKYIKIHPTDLHNCYFAHTCIQYDANKYNKANLEEKCKRESGLFTINSKCLQRNIVGFCQFSNYEMIYLSKDNFWMTEDAKQDCKSLKGKFVR